MSETRTGSGYYHGRRGGQLVGDRFVTVEVVGPRGSRPLLPGDELFDDFEWGYVGHGPRGLATAVLAERGRPPTPDERERFMREVIAELRGNEIVLSFSTIDRWRGDVPVEADATRPSPGNRRRVSV